MGPTPLGAALLGQIGAARTKAVPDDNHRSQPTDKLSETTNDFGPANARCRALEGQLRQAQKMEAIGRLAGGVAHDFNNLLTVIVGNGELLLNRLPPGEPSRDLVREIVAAAEQAADLTRRLLTFSRKAVRGPAVVDLKAAVAAVDTMLRRILGEDIRLTTKADPNSGAVRAEPGQVEQVLLNLAVNARDAMPRGGRLTIEVRNAELGEAHARKHPGARPGPHVMLVVTDTGCGMDPATLARIFEPFFTTKGDKGTGLGLATVHGIVKQCGGHVSVQTEPGRGSCFTVYLPRAAQGPVADEPRPSPAVLPRGSETVLLAEDEPGVRSLACHVLRGCGYTVLEARDGAEAVRLAEVYGAPINLLLTDVVMPGLGGRETAERVAAIYPGIKVVFLSGYTEEVVVRHGVQEADLAFLQKPFTPALLAANVREALDKRQ